MQLYFKLNLRATPNMGEYPILIALGNNRKTAYIPTEFSANPDFWLNEGTTILVPTPENQKTNALLILEKIRLEEKIKEGMELGRIFPDSNPVDIKAYVFNSQHIKRESRDVETIWVMLSNQKTNPKTRENNLYDVKRWKQYQQTPMDVRNINYEYNLKFLAWMKAKNYSASVIAHVFCGFRAVWYYALDSGVIQGVQRNPFDNLPKPSQQKKHWEALSKEQFQKVYLAKGLAARRGVDVWLLSFYLCGMNFADIYRLKKNDLPNSAVIDGRAHYIRSKMITRGGVKVNIKIPPIAEPLIEKYKAAPDDEYFFNFHAQNPIYKNWLIALCNIYIKMTKDLGFHITPYMARYTWATTAFVLGIQEAIIDMGLGHSGKTEAMRSYVKPNWGLVDDANAKVIDYLTRDIPTEESTEGEPTEEPGMESTTEQTPTE